MKLISCHVKWKQCGLNLKKRTITYRCYIENSQSFTQFPVTMSGMSLHTDTLTDFSFVEL